MSGYAPGAGAAASAIDGIVVVIVVVVVVSIFFSFEFFVRRYQFSIVAFVDTVVVGSKRSLSVHTKSDLDGICMFCGIFTRNRQKKSHAGNSFQYR